MNKQPTRWIEKTYNVPYERNVKAGLTGGIIGAIAFSFINKSMLWGLILGILAGQLYVITGHKKRNDDNEKNTPP